MILCALFPKLFELAVIDTCLVSIPGKFSWCRTRMLSVNIP